MGAPPHRPQGALGVPKRAKFVASEGHDIIAGAPRVACRFHGGLRASKRTICDHFWAVSCELFWMSPGIFTDSMCLISGLRSLFRIQVPASLRKSRLNFIQAGVSDTPGFSLTSLA